MYDILYTEGTENTEARKTERKTKIMKEYKNGSVKFDLSELNFLSILASEAAAKYKEDGTQ